MPSQPRLTRGLLLVLGFIATAGPLATDTYLPAFTDIAADLHASPSAVQMTLTAFMLGLGLGQLVAGPLSDRIGRRTVLMPALVLFAASSVAMIFTPNVEVFIALRAVQGLAGAAGIVLTRAIIVDIEKGAAAVRALSMLAMLVAVGPLIAPLFGGFISERWGWRTVLVVICGISLVMLVLSLALVRETLPVEQRHSGGPARTAETFARLLRDRVFVLLIIVNFSGFGALLAYISASPFVGQVMLSMTPTQYSLAFAIVAFSMVAGNMMNARLAGRVSPAKALTVGSSVVLASAIAMTAFTLTETLTVATFVSTAFVLSGGVSLILSNGTALALDRADYARGAGSALLGAAQFLGGALVSPIVGMWGEHTALPMSLTILAVATIALGCTLAAFRGMRR